jgi:adenylate cyclase
MKIRRALIYLALIIAASAGGYWLGETKLGTQAELRLYDSRFGLRGPIPVAQKAPITIVAVDEASLSRIETPLKLWHSHFARLIESIAQAGASVIAIDFVFSDITKLDPKGQDQFSNALLRSADLSTPIVLAYEIHDTGVQQPPDIIRIPALGVGHTFGFTNLTTDPDDFVRRQQLFVGNSDTDSSFALATVRAFEAKTKAQTAVHPEPNPLINYRSPGAFAQVPFILVLDAAEHGDSNFLRNQFQGRIVLVARVGQEGEEDLHSTPFYYWPRTDARSTRRTPGIEIHANAIATILDGRAIRPAPEWQTSAAGAVLAILITLACVFLSPGTAALLSGAALLVFAYIAMFWTFAHDVWLPVLAPAGSGLLAFLFSETTNYFLEGREKRRLRNLFKSYVNDKVIDRIVRDPSSLSLAGERKRVAVLFADIKDFTTWSESTDAEVVVQCLDVYFSAMVDAIQSNHGMVDKFMGDGIMAVFGAPLDDPEASIHAVDAARAMRSALEHVNEKLKPKTARPIQIGIGINSGEAIIGHVGSAAKREYTAIGDVVNTAARIESLTRKTGAGILISAATFNALDGRVPAELVGEFELKGKTVLVPVYRVDA